MDKQREGGFMAVAHKAAGQLNALQLRTPDEESQQMFRRNVSDSFLIIDQCII